MFVDDVTKLMFAVNNALYKVGLKQRLKSTLNNEQRTSNRLNEGLPKKMAREKFQSSVFLIGQVLIKKIWVENSVFAIQHIDNRKGVTEVPTPPPHDQTNPFAYSCSFTFNTSDKNCMIGQGGSAVKILKNNLL